MPEIGLLGSEGGATSSVVPTPIIAAHRYDLLKMSKLQAVPEGRSKVGRRFIAGILS